MEEGERKVPIRRECEDRKSSSQKSFCWHSGCDEAYNYKSGLNTTQSKSERNQVVENETRDQSLARRLKFVNLFPAGAGIFMAAGIFLTQYWKWFQTGEWPGAPMAAFVPQPLVQWAATKDGGLLGLKKFVLASLSIHASVWFFVTGCVCTFLLMEITKPLLKD